MKKALYLLGTILLFISIMYSCQKDEQQFLPGEQSFSVLLDGQQFAVNSKETMNTFIKRIVGNPDIRITESSLDEAESSIGKFNLIRAKYEQEDLV